MSREVTLRLADDACLFCGLHGEIAGGHVFIGKRNKEGWLVSDSGWVCIEHKANCEVQICPTCVKPHLPATTKAP